MKAIMKSDQLPLLKAISTESLGRKEAETRDPGARFDKLLSGLAEARDSSAKAKAHKAAPTSVSNESSTGVATARSRRTLDSILSDHEGAEAAAVHPHDANGDGHSNRIESEQGLAEPHNAMTSVPVDVRATPNSGLAAGEPERRGMGPHLNAPVGDADGRSGQASSPLAALARIDRSNAPQSDEAKTVPGLRTVAPIAQSDIRADRPIDRPSLGAHPVPRAAVQVDPSPRPSIALPVSVGAEFPTSPIASAAAAIQTEPSKPLTAARNSPRVPGETLSVLRSEKHFSPVAPTTLPAPAAVLESDEPRAGPAAGSHAMPSRTDAFEHRADSLPPRDSQKLTEERRAPLASRVEPQITSASSTASPMQQVTAAVAQEVGAPGRASAAEPLSLPAVSAKHTPLRILKVELEPAKLGHVIIHLRRTGDVLEVKVTAERTETASLLERDRHLLSRVLEANGYVAADVTVQSAPASQPSAGTSGSGVEGRPDQQTAAHDLPKGFADGERRPSREENEQRPLIEETGRDEQDRDPRSRGDLYI
jgi:chemotaxis protein MotD